MEAVPDRRLIEINGEERSSQTIIVSIESGIVMVTVASSVSMISDADNFSPWEVRARFVRLGSKAESDGSRALGLPSNAVNVQSVSLPEGGISYFSTKNISAERIPTYTQRMNVSVNNSGIADIGRLESNGTKRAFG